MTALKLLCDLADQRKRERSPFFPAKYIPLSRYNDRDATGLIRCIIDYLNFSGHFATRLSSADIKTRKTDLPEILAVVTGKTLFVNIKGGKEQLSATQKDTIKSLLRAGAWCYVSHSFEEFHNWFTEQFDAVSI